MRSFLLHAPLFLLNEEDRLAVGSEERELCGDDRLVDERQFDFVCFEHVHLAGLKHFLLAVHDRANLVSGYVDIGGQSVLSDNFDDDGNLDIAYLFGDDFKVQLVGADWFYLVTWTGRVDDS